MKLFFVLIFFSIKCLTCQRRITNGSTVGSEADTSFVVYLIVAGRYQPTPPYPGWLCGGCILQPALVLTSAACLVEAENIYVVSGYRKYVRPHLVHTDRCVKRIKRKIKSFCTMERSKQNGQWTHKDIAIARVRPVFDFYDPNYLKYCSYLPKPITCNFERKYEIQTEDVDVVAYGWGHAQYYRPVDDLNDYNEEYIQWTTTKLMNREDCMKAYQDPEIKKTIKEVAICTNGRGNYDPSGNPMVHELPSANGCEGWDNRRAGDMNSNETTRNCTVEFSEEKSAELLNTTSNITNINTRRNGICQNDHGSPLVTWIGGKPFVIGVATAFLVKENMQCVGPYVFMSVRVNSRFISCILDENKSEKPRTRRTPDYCKEDINFKIIRNNVTSKV